MSEDHELVSLGFHRNEATYALCAALFVVVLVLTNIIGTKLFVLFPNGGPSWLFDGGPWTLTSGIITYPITFLLTDLVSEIWGRRRADFMVWMGFGMSFLMLILLKMAVILPPSPIWVLPAMGMPDSASMQQAFEATFRNPSILLFASMLAYLVAQLFDVRLYHFWWKFTGGRHMWLRNNGSTIISQLVDTIIVNGIFLHFGLGIPGATIVQIILAVYLCKVALALIDTPFMYLGLYMMERFLKLHPERDRSRAPLG
ncbi:MAG: queuosine precursor transporter [Planctomycetes bacterium]|nr:queuosine precursor transporter [Planctomycetota bacterium]MCB9908979.1 queuosine precursor transporter [Planctomycetota bacterium]HPF15655.1 queuosine precursor transporter [Planctomycetota bacterium]